MVTILSLLQPAASATGGGGGGGAGPAGPAGCAGGTSQFGLIAVMFLVMYFLLIRPQQKRQREHDAMLKALEKGTIVRTNGGIRGEIVEIDDHEVTLKIADKTKINVLRSHIAGPIGTPAGDEGESK
ncbi:MAG: preprotein translocase subunit YajC [Sandaracinus sp.]|nr:preprotein translocase subunit YajC [Sandaracinus sp.]